MNDNISPEKNSKNIIITIIVLAALGFGFFLFKISPKDQPRPVSESFDIAKAVKLDKSLPVTEKDHVQGNFNAKNTLIEYGDFQCPACAVINPAIQHVVEKFPDTRLVFRNFPLAMHKNAIVAAYAVEAASAQGKFWEMKDKVYENQNFWSDMNYPQDKFMDYAKEIGVKDLEKFKKDIENKTYRPKIEADFLEATGLGLEGTPTLLFNGHKLVNMDLPGLLKQIEPFLNK